MTKSNKPLVTICIVDLNTFKQLRDCIIQLKKVVKIPYELLVLDLGDDGASYWCKENGIKCYKHSLPFYFAQSNNFLAKKVKTPYILFLNPDTLPYPKFLDYMLKEIEHADIVGARLMYANGTVQHSGLIIDEMNIALDDKYYLSRMLPELMATREVDAVCAACMLIKTKTFKKLGMFDEKYKNGYEDVDLCITAKKKGYKIVMCGRAEVTHYQGSTGGTLGSVPTSLEFLDENQDYLKKKWTTQKYTNKFYVNRGEWQQRLMIGTPTTGNIRIEWHLSRTGAVIPTNWSHGYATPVIPTSAPMNYLVPDAQNLIVRDTLQGKYEWLFLWEQDNLMPPDIFVKLNEYMLKKDVPYMSGLYFTKSVPPEPMIYTKSGHSYDYGWKMGDKVWCWGIPTGCTLIHSSLLKAVWDESPEYVLWDNQLVRRVFEAPAKAWYDPQFGYRSGSGTSDLAFCNRLREGHFFKKAGWSKYDGMEKPFLCDTSIFSKHISADGIQYPLEIPAQFKRK